MVLLVAKEKLIAASVAWCHSRGVLSAGACLKHALCGMNRDRGADFLPQRLALFCQTLWKICFSMICRVSSPCWVVNTESETPELQGKFLQAWTPTQHSSEDPQIFTRAAPKIGLAPALT